MATQFSAPEEKLWLVVRDYQGGVHKIGPKGDMVSKDFQMAGCVKLEKNSVIKLGRVRLRVRDIDYMVNNQDESKNKQQQNTDHDQFNLQVEPAVIPDSDSPNRAIPSDMKKITQIAKNNIGDTNLTEESDEAACRICWGTKREDRE